MVTRIAYMYTPTYTNIVHGKYYNYVFLIYYTVTIVTMSCDCVYMYIVKYSDLLIYYTI